MTAGIREAMRVSRAKVNDIQSSAINCSWDCIPYLSIGACFALWPETKVASSELEAELKYPRTALLRRSIAKAAAASPRPPHLHQPVSPPIFFYMIR